jgi:hypothetical protein
LNVRYAIASLFACAAAAAAGCSGDSGVELPVAPPSAITVAAPTGTVSGMTISVVLHDEGDCPASLGVAVRAAFDGADVTAVFPRWPDEGAVYDLSAPGTSDFVTVGARAAGHTYCAADEGAAGTIVVNHFDYVAGRWLIDVQLSGVVAGATTIDAHLYH